MSNETTYRAKVELVTSSDVKEFSELCKTVEDHDIYIKGFDEDGRPWQMNAKSFLGTIALTAAIEERNKQKEQMKNIVDLKKFKVQVPAGIQNNEKIRIVGQGKQGKAGTDGGATTAL